MVIGLTTYKRVNGFTDEQFDQMRAFLQGAVYCWCKNRKDEWFAAHDLLGGDNYYWQGIPLMPLYIYYLNGNEDNNDYAVEEAGKAAGRLFKEVLINDKRTIKTEEDYTRMYRWTGEEINIIILAFIVEMQTLLRTQRLLSVVVIVRAAKIIESFMEYSKPTILAQSAIMMADCQKKPCGRPSCTRKPSGTH